MDKVLIAVLAWVFWPVLAVLVAVAARATWLCAKEGRQLVTERRFVASVRREIEAWEREDEEINRLEALWRLPCRSGYMQGGGA